MRRGETAATRRGSVPMLAGLGVLLTLLAALPDQPVLVALSWLAFAAALAVARRTPTPVAVRLILIGAVAIPLAAALVPPSEGDEYVAPERYPPLAEAYVRLVPGVPPARPFQLVGVLLAVATTVVLHRTAKARQHDPRSVILWAWCPAVAIEAANNAHVEALAVLLAALALLCLAHRRGDGWLAGGGALLGLAVGASLTPVLVLPAVVRRRRPAIAGFTFPLVVAALYIPRLLRAGPGILWHLPGYPTGEGYAHATGFALLTLFLPSVAAAVVAAAILVGIAVWVVKTTVDERPWRNAAVMVGATLLAVTPGQPWYGLLLVVLVGLGARPVWLAVVAAGYVASLGPVLHVDRTVLQRVGYGLALAAVVSTLRLRRPRRPPRPAGPEEVVGNSA